MRPVRTFFNIQLSNSRFDFFIISHFTIECKVDRFAQHYDFVV